MEGNLAVLRRQLVAGSEGWSEGQLVNGAAAATSSSEQQFPLLCSARGDLDIQFATHQRALCMDSEWWSLLQDKDLHEANRSLVFRIIARSGAEYERLLSAPHRRAPCLLFLAIDTPTVIPVIKASPPCLLGEFTRSFLAEWDLDTPEARAKLVLILLSAKVDTAKIECWHAWWRRLSVRLKTQTHLPDVLDLCSRALVVRMRHRDEKLGKWQARPMRMQHALEAELARRHRQRRRIPRDAEEAVALGATMCRSASRQVIGVLPRRRRHTASGQRPSEKRTNSMERRGQRCIDRVCQPSERDTGMSNERACNAKQLPCGGSNLRSRRASCARARARPPSYRQLRPRRRNNSASC